MPSSCNACARRVFSALCASGACIASAVNTHRFDTTGAASRIGGRVATLCALRRVRSQVRVIAAAWASTPCVRIAARTLSARLPRERSMS